jgi:hypothetical protein
MNAMKTKLTLGLTLTLALATGSVDGARNRPMMTGDYLEVRSCDIYTGACVANAEMNLSGREGMMVWSIREGMWRGQRLDGLKVIAVLRTDSTLADVHFHRPDGQAVLIVDQRADPRQREALVDFAKSKAGALLKNVAAVKTASIESALGSCVTGSCATVKAGDIVEISTRCLGGKDHLCGNEENYYPPLTEVEHARSVYTEIASFKSPELKVTWEIAGKRSAYVGQFAY